MRQERVGCQLFVDYDNIHCTFGAKGLHHDENLAVKGKLGKLDISNSLGWQAFKDEKI